MKGLKSNSVNRLTKPLAVVGFCFLLAMLILAYFDKTIPIVNVLAIVCLMPESVRFVLRLN